MPPPPPSSSFDFRHVQKATVSDGVQIAFTTAGDVNAKQALLLIHGYPQTMYSMRHLLQGFQGMFVVAVDYRGAGASSITLSGYDKMTMASDLNALMTSVLQRKRYAVLGHDIGSMVATAQALRFRENVEALIMMECPQPGTSVYTKSITDPALTLKHTFHFFFHNALDLPEQLTYGREDVYLDHFYDRFSFQPNALARDDRQVYVDAFRRSGRMKAGFEVYRAFTQDDKDVRDNVAQHGKLRCPILATGGEHSLFTQHIEQIAKEVGTEENITFTAIGQSSHWVPEENPGELVNKVTDFLLRPRVREQNK